MIGSTLSHYRILALLGEGGMGVVYKALDTVLERPVALKVMHSDMLAEPASRQRFLQEARSAAALHHPNIATIFEANEATEAAGVLFIAMEFVEGESLRARMAQQPMPIADAIRVATEIADGLCHAHEHSVVHRDLKPENVLLTVDGRAKILDFGLAKILRQRAAAAGGTLFGQTETAIAGLTVHGQIMGTPAYMSPEQARGLDVDFRSDLFSFGAMFYEMVAGEPPFHGPTSLDTLSAVLHKQPPALAVRDRRLPPALDRVVARCLEKEPQARYPTTRALLDDLRQLDARPAAAGTVAMRRARGVFGRRRVGLAALAAVLLVAAGLFAAKPQLGSRDNDARTAGAATAAGVGGDAAARAVAPNWILVGDFEGVGVGPDVTIATRELVSASLSQSEFVMALTRSQVQRGLRLAGLPDTTRVTGEVARELATRGGIRTYVDGRVDKVLSRYSFVLNVVDVESRNVRLTVSDVAKDDAAFITTLDDLGRTLRRKLGEQRRAVKRTEPFRETYTTSFDAYRNYVAAIELQRKGDYTGGNRALRRALGLDPEFASAYIHLGTNYYNLGFLDSSQTAFAQAKSKQDRLTEPERLVWQFFVAYAVDYDLQHALEVSDLQLQQAQVGADPYNNRAAVLFDLGRYDDALAAQTLAVRASPFGAPTHVLNNEHQMLLQLGAADSARAIEAKLTGTVAQLATLARAVSASQWPVADSLAAALQSADRAVPRQRFQARLVQASRRAHRGAVAQAEKELAAAWAAAPNPFWADLARVAWLQLHVMAGDRIDRAALGASTDTTATVLVTGMAAAAAGDAAGASAALSAFAGRPAADRRRYEVDARLLEAWAAANAGLHEAAIGLLKSSTDGRGPWISGRIPVRWLLATALERSGRRDEAAQAFETVLLSDHLHQDVWTWRALALPFAHQRLAVLYAQMGRGTDAHRHLDALEAIWRNPDALAEPLLATARARVAAGPAQ